MGSNPVFMRSGGWAWYATRTPPEGQPVAVFSADPLTGSATLEVAFTDASTGQPTEWLWEISDDSGDTWSTMSTLQTPAPEELEAGTYSIRLTVTDEFSRSNTSTEIDYITVEE